MESGGSHNGDRQEGEVAKVVRIPRDWFGPADELVPIGGPEADADAPLDPNTFWDGSSSSIQNAVERPRGAPSDEAPMERGEVAYPILGRFSRTVRIRSLVASVVVLAVAAASITGWVLGGSHSKPLSSALALVTSSQGPALSMRRPHPSAAEQQSRPTVRVSRAVRVHHARRKASSSSPGSVTEVTYRSNSAGPSPSTTSGYQPETSAQGPSTASTGGNSGATGSVTAAKQSSPTAFGANGALGPMSSPDG